MSLTGFKAITLGCYGTLIDKASGVYGALRPLLAKAAGKLARDEVLAAFGAHESALEAEAPGMPYSALLTEVHRRLAKEWFVIMSEDDHRLFGMSVPDWPIFADTPAALQYLRRYFKLAILSNVDRESFVGSKRQLGVRFDAVFTAQDMGSYKPDHRSFDLMLQKLAEIGVKRGEILHVSQSPINDLGPAADHGLATAWIDRRRESAAGNATLQSAGKACWDYRFSSMADLAIAHQEDLRA